MSDFHFIYPWRLLLLVLCVALWWLPAAGRSAWSRIMDKPLAKALIIGRHSKVGQSLPWIAMLGVIALSGPTWHRQLPAALTPQSNVMIILQQDGAMLAGDLAPSRHERMQTKIMTLMERQPGTRFGLVVYHAGAWLTTPLTVDPTFYSLFLHAQNPGLLPSGEGSGLQNAVSLAIKNMPASPRSIILVADTLSAEDAAWLGKQTLPLQVWVPGTAQGGALPEKLAGLGIDTRLNVSRFEAIRNAGIPVTLVTANDDDLPVIVSHIEQGVTAQNNARGDLLWRNDGWMLVIPLLGMLFFWRRQLFCWVILAPLLLWQPAGHAAWLDAWISPDMQGQYAFSRGDYSKAAHHYTDPLRQGIAWYRAGNFPAATAAFHQAQQTPDVLVWTGNALAQQKQWQLALNSYDRALSLRPDWTLAQGNRAKIAAIVMQLRQKERDRQAAQGEEQDYKPDEIKHDLKPDQGVNQKDIQPVAGNTPQVSQWYENLTVSPSGLLENLYRTQPGGAE
ncbi:vWA domain-containing protein [Enterobacter hormaechei]|uniref:vWA domain-containing protein n=1 Tax=Enterobacter hormaechei TaxID=158836 RepID=UPI00197E0023|nr:tetratricopeptide repeat protein [Enterobacter hormaechei]MBN4832680.1 VWA domain-containing protein [Enterobacter hormaechei]